MPDDTQRAGDAERLAYEIARASIDGRVCCEKLPPCQVEAWFRLLTVKIVEVINSRDAALREARAEIERYRVALEATREEHARACDHYTAVKNELDRLRADAARYRYVRDELSPEDFSTLPAEELDAFIDAQMSERGEHSAPRAGGRRCFVSPAEAPASCSS